jgi:hypothetical protein
MLSTSFNENSYKESLNLKLEGNWPKAEGEVIKKILIIKNEKNSFCIVVV